MTPWAQSLSMRLVMGALVLALAACAHEAPRSQWVGDYELVGVSETASLLRLSADGTYRFVMSIGSVDEYDDGRWSVEGDAVELNSTVPDEPPTFAFVRSSRQAQPGIAVVFEGPEGSLIARLAQVRFFADGKTFHTNEVEGAVQRRRLDMRVNKLELMYFGALRSYPSFEHVPLDPAHNHFVFRARLGNYGKARFQRVRLAIERDALVMTPLKPALRLRYERVGSARAKGT